MLKENIWENSRGSWRYGRKETDKAYEEESINMSDDKYIGLDKQGTINRQVGNNPYLQILIHF